jgi:hypothetical protein
MGPLSNDKTGAVGLRLGTVELGTGKGGEAETVAGADERRTGDIVAAPVPVPDAQLAETPVFVTGKGAESDAPAD